MIAAAMGRPSIEPEITGKAAPAISAIASPTRQRRHASSASPRDRISRRACASWPNGLRGQEAEDRIAEARRELEARGLVA